MLPWDDASCMLSHLWKPVREACKHPEPSEGGKKRPTAGVRQRRRGDFLRNSKRIAEWQRWSSVCLEVVGGSYGWSGSSWGWGRFRPEGWHEVAGRRAGCRRGTGIVSVFSGAFPDAEVRSGVSSSLSPSDSYMCCLSPLLETPTVDGSLPHDRLRRTDSRPEPSSQPRDQPRVCQLSACLLLRPPPWAVPGSAPLLPLHSLLWLLVATPPPPLHTPSIHRPGLPVSTTATRWSPVTSYMQQC